MGCEWSVILRILFLSFLLLWQFGNGATFGSGTKAAANNVNTSTGGGLVDIEANALENFINLLSTTSKFLFSYSICSSDKNAEIRCSCNSGSCSITEINLASKKLDGQLSFQVGFFKNLSVLNLSNNHLSGAIPAALGSLQQLELLNLSSNNFNGIIPSSLSNLPDLKFLDLSSNKFNGVIPLSLAKLQSLEILNLDDNDLHGELPAELGTLINLRSLKLTSNKFYRTIPSTYGALVNLEMFTVGGNNLSGQIPDYFGKWINLTTLILMGNSFEGTLPAKFFFLPNLEILLVSGVGNPGISFPAQEVIMPNVHSVVLRNCNINGPIPSYIGKWPRLSYLDLSFNNLTGGVPETFQKLNKLFLTNNMLFKLPSWIMNPKPSIVYPKADLSYNNFDVKCTDFKCLGPENVNIHPTRTFIADMQKQKCLTKHKSLFINCGGGVVPMGKDNYHSDTSTSTFSLTEDDWAYSFSGDYLWSNISVSTLLGKLTNDVSGPEGAIDNNFRLAPVSLTYYGFCLQRGKYFVTLHFPEDDGMTGKRVFDVYIQRRIVLKDIDIKEIAKQNGVTKRKFKTTVPEGSLEIHFFWTGKGTLYTPPAINGPLISAISVVETKRNWRRTYEIAGIVIACVLLPPLIFAFMWRMGWIGDKELRETQVNIGERPFTLKQIVDATKKFSSIKELGRGRSGIVYKAELPDRTVAVKKLFTHSKAVDEIAREVYGKKVLDLKHENLVQLLATHSKNQLHLIIYEYMEHGSLKQALFDLNSTVVLDWEKRFNICTGIAKGLNHLHERNPQIIHRNIKATNILLDANYVAKISDFGLAKFYEEESSYNIMQAGGDAAYMAPEYATRGAITAKVDVYSFGIILLEIAGKLHARGKLVELVDGRLVHYNWDQANTILNLAIMCVDLSPSIRPTMSQILSVLEGKKTVEEISKEVKTSA